MTQAPPPPQSLQSEVITEIFTNIGESDRKYISALIDDLTEKNAVHTHNTDGFLYAGTFFSNLPVKQHRLLKKYPLDVSLHDEGQELVKATKELVRDTMRLKQGLILVLRDCKDMQDVRDALPNASRMVLPALGRFERTRPVAYTLCEKPLLFDQYGETERLLQYYLSSRMLD